jgi:hypothetical protein
MCFRACDAAHVVQRWVAQLLGRGETELVGSVENAHELVPDLAVHASQSRWCQAVGALLAAQHAPAAGADKAVDPVGDLAGQFEERKWVLVVLLI